MINFYKYKTNPIITAIQWNGDNVDEIIDLCGDDATVTPKFATGENELYVTTYFGIVHLVKGDYVAKISGEICVYSEESFNSIFELNDSI